MQDALMTLLERQKVTARTLVEERHANVLLTLSFIDREGLHGFVPLHLAVREDQRATLDKAIPIVLHRVGAVCYCMSEQMHLTVLPQSEWPEGCRTVSELPAAVRSEAVVLYGAERNGERYVVLAQVFREGESRRLGEWCNAPDTAFANMAVVTQW